MTRALRRMGAVLGVSCIALLLSAHVGTNDAYYDGLAGPYPVRVSVRMPGVIPGQAQISVRVLQGDARRVLVQAAQWNVGTRGAPAPDVAPPVAGAPGTFAAPLWLMTSGSYEVNVTVDGAQGTGTATVPVIAVATARLGMDRRLAWGVAALGGLLVAGLLTMAGAAARDGVLPPGEQPDRRRRTAGRIASSVATAIVALALLGGSRWWDSVDAGYARNLWRPLRSTAHVTTTPTGARLRFTVTDSVWVNHGLTPLIPDHGKLMHMFVVRDGDRDVLAHLHPTRIDSTTFESALPPLPAGRYRVFADVVHESGLVRTFVTNVGVPATATAAPIPTGGASDGDDAWFAGRSTALDAAAPLGDGLTLAALGVGPVPAGVDTTLRFVVRDSAGRTVEVEPYLGMAGHAIVMRDDGAVFVHLHPMGTISLAAQQRLLRRERGDTVMHGADQPADDAAHAMHAAAPADLDVTYPGTIAFPFAFPKPGQYRVWVQVKHGGRVRTAAFDVAAR